MGLYTIQARRRFDKRPRRSNTNFRKNRSSMFEREREREACSRVSIPLEFLLNSRIVQMIDCEEEGDFRRV